MQAPIMELMEYGPRCKCQISQLQEYRNNCDYFLEVAFLKATSHHITRGSSEITNSISENVK